MANLLEDLKLGFRVFQICVEAWLLLMGDDSEVMYGETFWYCLDTNSYLISQEEK